MKINFWRKLAPALLSGNPQFPTTSQYHLYITGISNLCVDVTFYYNNYKDYRADIDYLYTEIINRLRFKGLINQQAGV